MKSLARLCIAMTMLATSTTACLSPRGANLLANVATTAVVTAAIVGQLSVLAYHDDHYHYHDCGHNRRWHDDRWAYYYGAQWEYYDAPSATWYVYAE